LARHAALALVLIAAFLATGCSSSGSSDTGQLRFVAVSPDAPHVDLLIDGTTQGSNLAYGNTTDYLTVKTESRRIQAVPVSSSTPLLDTTVSVTKTGHQTLLMTGAMAKIKSLLLTDGGTTSSTGNGYVRVINTSVAMGPADVYIVTGTSGITGATPVIAGLDFDGSSSYQLVAAGNYRVVVTTPGTKSILLDTGPLNMTASQNWTMLVLDDLNGGFSFSALQDQ
jgi:Domain of unknown function (DUF4397)